MSADDDDDDDDDMNPVKKVKDQTKMDQKCLVFHVNRK